ncbi:MAG: hypothetical protein ACN4GM_00755 [Gammaproteobacteria bacterium]
MMTQSLPQNDKRSEKVKHEFELGMARNSYNCKKMNSLSMPLASDSARNSKRPECGTSGMGSHAEESGLPQIKHVWITLTPGAITELIANTNEKQFNSQVLYVTQAINCYSVNGLCKKSSTHSSTGSINVTISLYIIYALESYKTFSENAALNKIQSNVRMNLYELADAGFMQCGLGLVYLFRLIRLALGYQLINRHRVFKQSEHDGTLSFFIPLSAPTLFFIFFYSLFFSKGKQELFAYTRNYGF